MVAICGGSVGFAHANSFLFIGVVQMMVTQPLLKAKVLIG